MRVAEGIPMIWCLILLIVATSGTTELREVEALGEAGNVALSRDLVALIDTGSSIRNRRTASDATATLQMELESMTDGKGNALFDSGNYTGRKAVSPPNL